MPKILIVPCPNETRYRFWCPGCNTIHEVNQTWGFNGDIASPTFTPSIMVVWEGGGIRKVCHSFVEDGKIRFLDDCTHSMAGETVELSECEEGMV